jgi:hypothetical protein
LIFALEVFAAKKGEHLKEIKIDFEGCFPSSVSGDPELFHFIIYSFLYYSTQDTQ